MKIKKIIIATLTLALSTSLFSCVKFSFNISTKVSIATASEVKETIENKYGDKLFALEGDVFTLSKYPLPKVGDKLNGFTVDVIYDFDYKNAKIVMFTHEKSKAKVILISNDDEDKTAVIGFNTLTYDNKGIPHVFEHACLGGSGKYPNANLFTEAVNKTYNTFMNAVTMQHATVYPISSLSDEQLFELYKFYLDGVMDPDVLRDENNLSREAYRYILKDKAEDIDLSGVVYSEMSGVEGSIANVAYRNALKTMYKGSFMGVNTGGDTSDIPSIKNEDLVEFHNKYYHPSNMVITLYGNIDYEKYLKYTDDEYLNNFSQKEIDKSDNGYVKSEEFKIQKFDFPFTEDDKIEKQTIISYNVNLEDMSQYECGLFTAVTNSLFKSDGPIDRILKEKIPDATFENISTLDTPKPFFTVFFYNVNESDANVIKSIVEDSFAEVRENGIDKSVIDEIVDTIEINKEDMKDSHGFADKSIANYSRIFASNGEDISGFLRYDKGLEDISYAFDNGDIDTLIEKYLSSNANASMTLTVPKNGLYEEKMSERSNKLKQMKESMSEDEIDDLVKKNNEYDEWAVKQVENSIIDKLRVASVSSLDEYRAKCYAYEENVEGIRFIRSDISDIKTNYFNMMFDASSIKFDDIYKLSLISNLLLELPTTNYAGKKLESEFNRYMASYNVGLTLNYYYEGGYKPYFSFSARSLDKNFDKVFELIQELMFETKFEDVDKVRSIVSSAYNDTKTYIRNSPNDYARDLVMVQNDSDYLYANHANGLDYFRFLKKVNEMSDEELQSLLKECKDVLMNLYNKSGFVCQIISNFDTMKVIKNKVIDMSYDFEDRKTAVVDYNSELNPLEKRIAVLINGAMQYNYVSIPMAKDGIDYSGKMRVLSSILDDRILYPEFRAKRSAYGSYSTFNRIVSYLFTYRDPNLKESYQVYKTIPELLKNMKITEDELEDYKLNAYAGFSYPLTKYEAAKIAIDETMQDVKEKRPSRYVRFMKEIKEMKLEDLNDLYQLVEKLIAEGKSITVGSREQIESNKDMFDEIIYDYVQ